MLRAFVATWGHKAICASLDIKIFQSSLYLISAFHSPFFLSGHKFTSPGAPCTFFTRGIKIINNSSLLLVSRLWIIHHTIPAGYCLLLICLILLLCWGEGNLVLYLPNRSHFISYLVSVFVSSADNWIHFLGGITPRSYGAGWCRLFTYVFALDVSVIIFPLKGHFLVVYYGGVGTNWMNSLVRAGFHQWMCEEPIFTCNQHELGKKRGRKLSLRTNESSPFCRLSPALMEPPHAAMPPSHHQSSAGKGATGIRFFICARAFVSWSPPGEAPSSGCHTDPPPPFFFSAAKVSEFKKRSLKVTFCSHLSGCIHVCPRRPQATEVELS